jgi:hypothetical protein
MRYIIFASLLLATGCVHSDSNKTTGNFTGPTATLAVLPQPVGFNEYWYQGKAELTAYAVVQERYGEQRPAEQVNVFVTEDFSRQKQVKLDDPDRAGADRGPVLKLNTVRKFKTGIYDYSLMQSVFTPVDGTGTLKTTCSVQDWCGHVFSQLNLDKKDYRIRQFSYFESEGDPELRIPANALLEDDLWVRLRLDPAKLPLGKVNILPGSFYLRLRHKPYAAHPAVLNIEKRDGESVLSLRYEDISRTLNIRFENNAPYRIIGWEETADGKLMSKGERKSTLMSAYWSQNSPQYDGLRDSLKLEY